MGKRKRANQAPNFVLWTKESQRRFAETVARGEDTLDRLNAAGNRISHQSDQMERLLLELARITEETKHTAEKLARRSAAAAKANATRQARAAAAAGFEEREVPETIGGSIVVQHPGGVVTLEEPPTNDVPAELQQGG